jgi:hypothetical protein
MKEIIFNDWLKSFLDYEIDFNAVKPTLIRLYEGDKSFEDFTISYSMKKGVIPNFTIREDELNGVKGIVLQKANRRSTRHVFLQDLPYKVRAVEYNKKSMLWRLDLYYKKELYYYPSGERRYDHRLHLDGINDNDEYCFSYIPKQYEAFSIMKGFIDPLIIDKPREKGPAQIKKKADQKFTKRPLAIK